MKYLNAINIATEHEEHYTMKQDFEKACIELKYGKTQFDLFEQIKWNDGIITILKW